MTEKYEQYLKYKESHPNDKVSFSKWRLIDKVDKKQDRHRASYQKLTNKKLYFEKKNKEYREEIKKLKSDQKKELARQKREIEKPVVYRRLVRYSRKCECESRKTREILGKALDKKGLKSANLIKLLIGINECISDDKTSPNHLTILSLASIVEYLDAETLLRWLNIRRTTLFNCLQSLTNQGYLSVAQVKSINKKKAKNRYFITLFGSEYLQSFINRIGRKTHNIIK